MINTIYNKFVIIGVLLIATGFGSAHSQNITATAPNAVTAGKPFTLTLNSEMQGDITFPEVDGLRILSGPNAMVSYSSSNINGKITNVTQISYSYVLTLSKEGNVEIPPLVLKSGGKQYSSNKLNLQVFPPDAQAPQSNPETKISDNKAILLQQIPSSREVYLGEQFTLSTKIFVRERLQVTDLKTPSYNGFWNEELEADQQASRDIIEGQEYATQVIKRNLLAPQKTGELIIEPAEMDVMVQKLVQRQRSRNPFGDIFDDPFFDSPFNSYENVPEHLSSNSVKINVKPLPPGAPASFSGAVGKFTVKASVNQDSIQINEAVNLRIAISGVGNLSLIPVPKIDFPPDIEVFEPKLMSDIKHSSSGSAGSVTYEYLLIPRKSGTYRIAPVEFSWFNPDEKKYSRFVSGEFVFSATGANNQSGDPQLPGIYSSQVRNIGEDIRFIKLNAGNLRLKDNYLVKSGWNLLYLVFILLIATVYILVKQKEKDIINPGVKRNKKAKSIAYRRMRNAEKLINIESDEFYEELLRAFWGYFSDKLGIKTGGLSRDNLNGLFANRNLDEQLIANIWEVVDECEMSRYARTTSTGRTGLYEKAVDCLAKTEQIL